MTETIDDQLPLLCKKCGGMNKPHPAKPMIEVNNGTVTCIACGATWPLKPSPPRAVA